MSTVACSVLIQREYDLIEEVQGRAPEGDVPMTTMLRAAALSRYPELVAALGGKPDSLLKKFRISTRKISDSDGLIPLRSFVYLLEDTALRLDCPDFGLRFAAEQDASFLGPLAVGMRNTETVADAMEFIARYLFIHSPGVSLQLIRDGSKVRGTAELRFQMMLPNVPIARQVNDLGLGNTHQIMKIVAGEKYRPVEIELPHRPLASLRRYQQYFGAPVRVGQPFAKIVLRQSVLKMPVQFADPLVRRMAEHYLASLYPVPGESLASRVRVAIRSALANQGASKVDIAAVLSMHPRTLCKKLSDESTTFERVRDEVRKEAASQYLRTTQMPLSQVVGLLGLSEQAVLTRLCRRWFGETPSAIRKASLPP